MVLGFIIGTLFAIFDVLYWTKYLLCWAGLKLQKRITRRRFDLYDFDAKNEPEKLGVLVPKEERIWESPQSDHHLQKATDEIFIYGVNTKNQSLVVRVSRSLNDESEAWVYLKLADGHWYQLEEIRGHQRNFGDRCTSFTCGGLQMHYMSAMRRWRIVYSGMMRERKAANGKKENSVFVKFTFIWSASSDVFDFSYDLDTKAMADAMARSKWNSFFPPLDKVSKVMNFYAQSGVLNGTASVDEEPDIEMYLFGERIRHLGGSKYLVGCKFKHVLGVVPESGLILHLGKASFPNMFHNIHFGYIVHPNNHIYGITEATLISKMSEKDDSAENLTAAFNADKRYELKGNLAVDGLHFTSEKGWNGHLEMREITFDIGDCKGNGFMLLGEVSKLPDNYNERKSQNLLSPSHATRPLTVFFTDEVSHRTDLSGGKGSSLGKLTKLSRDLQAEFVVPRGIIVTTAAYEEFLTSEIKDSIDNLKNIVYGNTKGNIKEACKMVQCVVERTYLPDKITKEIEEKCSKLFDGNTNHYKVAVRSSATGEDTDQMSAAGQMDTFLGVKGLKEILTAVKKCWASQFGHIATEYKRQNGQILNSPMAVVIQEMVACESAGVLFTCDPLTNNPSVIAITANYGLGESVVSGSEEPDTIVLRKTSNEEVRIKSKTVGLKQRRIVLTDSKASGEEDGTITEDVPEGQRKQCCITDDIAEKLGKLSLKIENYFKSPRDIEWGVKSGAIYILQSRPITTGGSVSDYEITHEFDAPLRSEIDFNTKENVGEVMPGATSPLGLNVVTRYFSIIFQSESMKKKQRTTFMQAKYFPNGINAFYGHVHMSVAEMVCRLGDLDSIDGQAMMMAIFGRVLHYPELKAMVKHKNYAESKSLANRFQFFWDAFFGGRGIERIKDTLFNYQLPAEGGRTAQDIFDLNMHSCSDFAETLDKHMTCSEMSAMWNMIMFGTLSRAKGSVDNDVYGDFAKLLASSSNVESADIPSGMQRVAESIAKCIKPEKFKEMCVEEAGEWLETSTNIAGYTYRQFIKRHGHRCLKEFDVHSIPWGTDSKPLIKLLQNMASSPKNVEQRQRANLTTPLTLKDRLLLKLILPNCRRGVREREACKSNLIKGIDNIRKGFRCLSKAMVAEGYIPDADIMYFLTIDEIQEVLESRNSRHIARAIHRRRLFPYLDSLLFPNISIGLPVPINDKLDEEVAFVADLTMKGIPVSQGTVKGFARVALTLEEASHLKRGEILITYSTDIGWSPYFPILAGVVTEIGGLISHGAVVSREYGLPCVVGLHGATKQFVTGDYVLLDGSKGLLKRMPQN